MTKIRSSHPSITNTEIKYVNKAIKALQSHVSQIQDPNEAAKWMTKRRVDLGDSIGCDYAEGFRRYKLS